LAVNRIGDGAEPRNEAACRWVSRSFWVLPAETSLRGERTLPLGNRCADDRSPSDATDSMTSMTNRGWSRAAGVMIRCPRKWRKPLQVAGVIQRPEASREKATAANGDCAGSVVRAPDVCCGPVPVAGWGDCLSITALWAGRPVVCGKHQHSQKRDHPVAPSRSPDAC